MGLQVDFEATQPHPHKHGDNWSDLLHTPSVFWVPLTLFAQRVFLKGLVPPKRQLEELPPAICHWFARPRREEAGLVVPPPALLRAWQAAAAHPRGVC